ncbi:MAG: hypothetical protein C0407_10805, partial [Desulfobacca sp.]|nr:hypothetical protein [Desulfobacca sp.]
MIKKGIVIVSQDDSCIKALRSILKKALYRPDFVPSLSEAKARLEHQNYQVLLIDLDQPSVDNRYLKELRKDHPVLGLIGISNRKFHQELEEAMSRYIDACFDKSEDYED